MKPNRVPLLAGRKQTRIDVPRVLRLFNRWCALRLESGAIPWQVRNRSIFYLWAHRGYYDVESMCLTAKWAVEQNDALAALIATLCTGLSNTQRSKIVNIAGERLGM